MDEVVLGVEFFAHLERVDREIASKVGAGGCPHCGGRLHRGDYPRKPRGGFVGKAGECFTRRLSFCCSEEGCRKRATPPSVRFLGRRVYLGAVVIVASIVSQAHKAMAEVARRTRRRWESFWRESFPRTSIFVSLLGRLSGAVSTSEMPRSLLERFEGDGQTRLRRMLIAISGLSTTSITDWTRCLRDIV